MLRTARPRVLHVIASLDGGGVGAVLLTVLGGLGDVQQTLALGGPGSLVPLVPPGVPILRFRSEGQLAKLMLKVRPDVVRPGSMARCSLRRCQRFTWVFPSFIVSTTSLVS